MGRQGSQRRRGLEALVLLLACASLTACGGKDDAPATTSASTVAAGLSVEVEPASAAPGDAVEARVVNHTGEDFTYGAAYEMEAQAGGTWKPVKLPVEPVPEIGYIARAGGTGPPVHVELPKDLEPGTYRIVIRRNVPGVGDLSGELEVTGAH